MSDNLRRPTRLDRAIGFFQALNAVYTWRFVSVLALGAGALSLLTGIPQAPHGETALLISIVAAILSLKEGD